MLDFYSFFTHLVDVLGPKEFLAPICLLLMEKSANKIIRSQNQGKDKDGLKDDLQGALGLPTMLVHHYPYDLQVWVSDKGLNMELVSSLPLG